MKLFFQAINTFESPFTDENYNNLGTYKSLSIDGNKYSIKLKGFKKWYEKSNQYDPYYCMEDFNPEGIEEWIEQGYEYAVLIEEMLPDNIEMYYGFIKFIANDWRTCYTKIQGKKV